MTKPMSHFSKADLSKYFYYISGKKEQRKFLIDKMNLTKIERIVRVESDRQWGLEASKMPQVTRKTNINYKGRIFLS